MMQDSKELQMLLEQTKSQATFLNDNILFT